MLQDMDSKGFWAIVIAMQVVNGAAIVANLLVIAVFAATKKLRSKYYGFVLNLVLADIAAPTLSIVYKYRRGNLVNALLRTSFFAAELSILAVALNRLIALSVSPVRYDKSVTHARLSAACILIWIFSALLYIPTTYLNTPFALWLMRPIFAITGMVITGVIYFAVFRKIANYREPLACTPGVSEHSERTGIRVRRTRQLMITFSIIMATYCVCRLPFCISNFMIFSSGKGEENQTHRVGIFQLSSVFILMLSSVINPFIYWWRISDFRRGLCRLSRVYRRQQKADIEPRLNELGTAMETVM